MFILNLWKYLKNQMCSCHVIKLVTYEIPKNHKVLSNHMGIWFPYWHLWWQRIFMRAVWQTVKKLKDSHPLHAVIVCVCVCGGERVSREWTSHPFFISLRSYFYLFYIHNSVQNHEYLQGETWNSFPDVHSRWMKEDFLIVIVQIGISLFTS